MFFHGSSYGAVRTASIFTSGAILMTMATMAGAQNSEGARDRGDYIEEVMVTARKRPERLQDLAGSGAALNEALLRDIGGVSSLRDVLDQIVGVTITETNSGDLAEPSIRGAGQSRNRASVSAAGIYRNGAYFVSTSLGGRSFERFDTFDVERVEVLRGPQGALYGRNSLGGAINMISKKPEQELYYEISARAGENDMFGGDVIVNVPLTEQFSARLSYAIEDQDDGFYKDINGNPVDQKDYEHIRFSVRSQPSDAVDVTYSYDYMDETNPIGILIRRSGSVLDLTGGDPFQTTINSKHETQHEVHNHNLLIDYDLPGGTISSVTNFRDRDLRRLQDDDQNGPSAAAATRNLLGQTDVDAEILFQELRFVSDVMGPISYLVGADYYGVDTVEDIDDFARGGQVTPNSNTRIVDIE